MDTKSEIAPSLQPKRWLTVTEAAQYLNKAVKTLYNLRSKGKLKGFRAGGTGALQFTVEDLDQYVLGHSRPPKQKGA